MARKTSVAVAVGSMTAPVPSRASAGGKGHSGGALAHEVIADIERDAREHTRQLATQKERLTELVLLERADHLAFRTDIEARMSQISDSSKAAGKTMQVYRAENPETNTIYTYLSQWKSLSLAIEAGWRPDLTKTWQEIGTSATAAKTATGKADPKLVEKLRTVQDMKLPRKQKEAQIAAVVKQINATVPKIIGPTQRTSTDRTAKIVKMIEKTENGYTLADCIKLRDWLSLKITAMQELAAKPGTPATEADNAKAVESAKRVLATPSGRKSAVPAREAEHATANTRKGRKSAKHAK